MSEHTPTPWRSTLSPLKRRLCIVSGPDDSYTWICGNLHNDRLAMPAAEAQANANLIVKAVNSHDTLVAELRRLHEICGHQTTADLLAAVGSATGERT